MAKDPYWPKVVLAMHMDGVNGATTITDVRGKSVYLNGGTHISTSQSKFGGASLYFDGTGDRASVDHADMNLGTGDFTVEFFVYFQGTTAPYFFSTDYPRAGGYLALSFNGATGTFTTSGTHVGTNAFSGYATGQWYHVAYSRASGVTKFFIDGVEKISKPDTTNLDGTTVYFGGVVGDISSTWLDGYIDEFRLTKGVGRYASSFSVATGPFPDSGPPEIGGSITDSNGNGIARTIRVYRRDTGALLGTAVSSAATGTYNIAVAHDGEVQVVMLDDVAGTVENDQILRTTPV